MKKFFIATCIVALVVSCTDSKYDLDNMDEDVHLFDNGVYFPLLTTDIPFSRMIEGHEDNIGLQENGIYYIHTNEGEVNVKGEILVYEQEVEDESEIQFTNIPEFLCDENVNLYLENPAFLARINNQGTLHPFTATLTFTPVYEDGSYGESVAIPPITIYEEGVMNIYLARERIQRIDDMGYTFHQCSEMQKFFIKIPQYIKVKAVASSPEIGMYGTVNMEISYNLDLPLSVEGGTTLTYVTQEDGLSDVFDVVSISELTLIANCTNYYPMDIEFDVIPYDSNGEPILDIEVTTEGKISSSLSNEPVAAIQPSQSVVYIKLKEKAEGRITDIDGLELKLDASFPNDGSITKWENLIIKIVADAPHGVEIITD